MILDISSRQAIHMKCQVIFSLKNNFKKIKMSSAAVVIGAIRVNLAKEQRNLAYASAWHDN